MENLTLLEMAKAIFANNKQKGFWENPRSVADCADLVISELSEALEAERANKFTRGRNEELLYNPYLFQEEIKDTLEDELADAFIRMLDLFGAVVEHCTRHEIPQPEICETLSEYEQTYKEPAANGSRPQSSARLKAVKRIAEMGMTCQKFTIGGEPNYYNYYGFAPQWRLAMISLVEVWLSYGYDFESLQWHIDAKVSYNKSRPAKHGKAF